MAGGSSLSGLAPREHGCHAASGANPDGKHTPALKDLFTIDTLVNRQS